MSFLERFEGGQSVASKITPRLPKGMRDFLPQDMLRRRFVVETVRSVFEEFGFEPLDTPVLELEETLLGKYGPEAEKLIYFAHHPEGRERLALRYDLSVPLSRVMAMHQDLAKPFRRYQISPVWRAERPQRGRYREFYQCDVDIVGSARMLADAEILGVIDAVLSRLGFTDFAVKMNNRKILNGIGRFSGVPEGSLGSLYRAIDKLEKIGAEGAEEELRQHQIPPAATRRVLGLLEIRGDNRLVLAQLRARLESDEEAAEGLAELDEILSHLEAMGAPPARYRVEFTMVRGLEYYTGPIYETFVERPAIGSLTGGGRYDRLIGLFMPRSLPATGTTIGIERILDVMQEFGMFPGEEKSVVQVLMTVFSQDLLGKSLHLASLLRRAGVKTEVFLEAKKLTDQLRYAQEKGVPFVAILGPKEVEAELVTIKSLRDGTQRDVAWSKAAEMIQTLTAGPAG